MHCMAPCCKQQSMPLAFAYVPATRQSPNFKFEYKGIQGNTRIHIMWRLREAEEGP